MNIDSKNEKGLMVKFVRKPKPVYAIQYNGHNLHVFEKILGHKVYPFDYGGPTFDATGFGGNYVSKGRWMLINPRKSKTSLDRVKIMEDWEFQRQYKRKK